MGRDSTSRPKRSGGQSMNRMLGYAGLLLVMATPTAAARVTKPDIAKREPFAAGQAFGNVGAYEKVVGRFRGELDPTSPLNTVIVDLGRFAAGRGLVKE